MSIQTLDPDLATAVAGKFGIDQKRVRYALEVVLCES
jgi:hypothetical protein